MFGSIGTFNAAGSKFNNAAGNQYNTNIPLDIPRPPTSNMAGMMHVDPHFNAYLTPSSSPGAPPISRRTSAAHMFGDIDHFNADRSTFNNAARDQFNYDDSYSGPSMHTSPSSIAIPPTVLSVPSPNNQNTPSPEVTPSSAEARMFGRINHFQSENSTYNNSMGNQINISGKASPAIDRPRSSLQNNATPTSIRYSYSSKNKMAAPHHKPIPNHVDGSDFADKALGVTDFVLTTLQTAAQYSPLPFLAQAAGLALNILQGVQGSMANKDGFSRLANHACNLISSVAIVQKELERDGRKLAPEVVDNLVNLIGKLRPIEEFVLKQNARHGLKRVLMYKADAAKVAENREKLMEALAEFGLRSNIAVQDGVAQIDKRLEDLVEAIRHIGLQHAHVNASSALPSVSRGHGPSSSFNDMGGSQIKPDNSPNGDVVS